LADGTAKEKSVEGKATVIAKLMIGDNGTEHRAADDAVLPPPL
jgi:hypothetical protein